MQNSVLAKMNKQINLSSSDKIWSYDDFGNFTFDSVAKGFSVLTQKGILERVEKGYYYKPKKTLLGKSLPNVEHIILHKLQKKGYFACVSGLTAYNKLGFTTQVPNITYIACNKKIISSNKNYVFLYRNKPHSGKNLERVILDAIIDIDKIPDTTPNKVILKIKKMIDNKEISLSSLVKSALLEKPKVRAIIGSLAQEYNYKDLSNLKKSLNPATKFKIKNLDVLEYRKDWNIVDVSISK